MTKLTEYQLATYHQKRRQGYPAKRALELARAHDAAEFAYSRPAFAKPFSDMGSAPSDSLRWCENVDAIGLRFVDYADKLVRLDHTGWYTDPDGFESIRGAVWQLPARNGRARYVAGYPDPINDGAARIDSDTIEGELGGDYGPYCDADHDAKADAARRADQLAERVAESERDYQTAWQAGSLYATLGDEIADTRRQLLTALAERRKVERADLPALCDLLKQTVRQKLATIEAARTERNKLREGERDGLWFFPNADMCAAFNDGAGENVLA